MLLDEVGRLLPPDAWLVTYNGRGFDWPLLVTRYRMARREAPAVAGHLDLLPHVRRLFRHRLDDARLGTVERMLLGVARTDDVDGWEIPGRYLGFLRGGPAQPLAAVVRHNHEDVRSLARLVAHVDQALGDPAARIAAPRGDLAGLARAFRRERRFEEAIDCLDAALARDPEPEPPASPSISASRVAEEPWWSPRRRADFGGRPEPRRWSSGWDRRGSFSRPWDEDRIAVDRARLLRRLGRIQEAVEAWDAIACGPGRTAVMAAIEAAKLREHRLSDAARAMATVERGLTLADRRRARGLPEPALEADLRHRWGRLRRASPERLRSRRLPRAAGRYPGSSASRTGPARSFIVARSYGAGRSNADRTGTGLAVPAQLLDDRFERRRERRAFGRAKRRRAVSSVRLQDRREGSHGLRARATDQDGRQPDGPFDRRRVPTDRRAMLVEDPVAPRERSGKIAVGVPDVGGLGDDPQRPSLPAPAHDQRQSRLDRQRVVACPVGREPRPVDRDRVPVQQPAADPGRLSEPVDPPTQRQEAPAECLVLRAEPPGAQAQAARPPDAWSRAVAIFTSSAGFR